MSTNVDKLLKRGDNVFEAGATGWHLGPTRAHQALDNGWHPTRHLWFSKDQREGELVRGVGRQAGREAERQRQRQRGKDTHTHTYTHTHTQSYKNTPLV